MRRVVVEENAKGEVRGLHIRFRRGLWHLYADRDRNDHDTIVNAKNLHTLLDWIYRQ